jgi:predicted nicotinamide N-methyase
LFGLLWPAGLALADEMSRFPIAGKTILEVGCGLGASSLVLQRRGADVTATDHHPLAEEFLRINAALNGLRSIPFRRAAWADHSPDLGRFDLIIASDVLYERDHPHALAAFLARHATPTAEVIIADPCRSNRERFRASMRADGFTHTERRRSFPGTPAISGRIMSFLRREHVDRDEPDAGVILTTP